MESIEKTIEEGMDFIELFHLPVARKDYFLHKNQVDLFICELKKKNIELILQKIKEKLLKISLQRTKEKNKG